MITIMDMILCASLVTIPFVIVVWVINKISGR